MNAVYTLAAPKSVTFGRSFRLLSIVSSETRVKQLREQFFGVRHQKFVVELGWENKTDRDEYDPYADSYVSITDGQVIKGCRIIDLAIVGHMPVMDHLNPDVVLDPSGVEISRLAGVDSYMSRGFFHSLLGYLQGQGHKTVYMLVLEPLLRVLKRKTSEEAYTTLPGTPMEKVGRDGRRYRFLPVAMRIEKILKTMDMVEMLETL